MHFDRVCVEYNHMLYYKGKLQQVEMQLDMYAGIGCDNLLRSNFYSSMFSVLVIMIIVCQVHISQESSSNPHWIGYLIVVYSVYITTMAYDLFIRLGYIS